MNYGGNDGPWVEAQNLSNSLNQFYDEFSKAGDLYNS